jgi:hypothetical protein
MSTFSFTKSIQLLLDAKWQNQTPFLHDYSLNLLQRITGDSLPFQTHEDCKGFLAMVLIPGAITNHVNSHSTMRHNADGRTSSLDELTNALCNYFESDRYETPSGWGTLFKKACEFGKENEAVSLIDGDGYIADHITLSRTFMLAKLIRWLYHLKYDTYNCYWQAVHEDLRMHHFFDPYIGENNAVVTFMAAYMHVLTATLRYGKKPNQRFLFGAMALLFRDSNKIMNMTTGGNSSQHMKKVDKFIAAYTQSLEIHCGKRQSFQRCEDEERHKKQIRIELNCLDDIFDEPFHDFLDDRVMATLAL